MVLRCRPLRVLGLVLLTASLMLAGCESGTAPLAISGVQPAIAAPGSFILVAGQGFEPTSVVWIDGRPAHDVTWVNARLLTAVLPADLAPGAYPLEVRTRDGQRDAVALNVGTPPPIAASAMVQPQATTPPASAAIAPRPSPNRTPDRGQPVRPNRPVPIRTEAPAEKDKDKDDKKEKDKDERGRPEGGEMGPPSLSRRSVG